MYIWFPETKLFLMLVEKTELIVLVRQRITLMSFEPLMLLLLLLLSGIWFLVSIHTNIWFPVAIHIYNDNLSFLLVKWRTLCSNHIIMQFLNVLFLCNERWVLYFPLTRCYIMFMGNANNERQKCSALQ